MLPVPPLPGESEGVLVAKTLLEPINPRVRVPRKPNRINGAVWGFLDALKIGQNRKWPPQVPAHTEKHPKRAKNRLVPHHSKVAST